MTADDQIWLFSRDRPVGGLAGGSPRLECQVMKAVIRIETSSPGSSTPSLAT
jgi:hypothetical protein